MSTPQPDPTDLPTIHVKPGPDIQSESAFLPQFSSWVDNYAFPSSPFGDYSYFEDYYIYQCGLAYRMHLSRILRSGADAFEYIENCGKADRVAAATGMGASDAHLNAQMQVADNRTFSGNALSPFRGLLHYFTGNGEDMSIGIDKLFIQQPLIDIREAGTQRSLFDIAGTLGSGTHPLSLNFYYDTAASGAAMEYLLGNIEVNLTGTITVNGDGSFTVSGDFSALPDLYDGNAANRGFIKEVLTSFIRGGTVYQTNITGIQHIEYDSNKPFFIGPPRWMRNSAPQTRQINGNPNGWDSVYFYYDNKDQSAVGRTGQSSAVIVRPNETILVQDIKQIVFRDDFYFVEDLPIIPNLDINVL